MGWIIWQQRAPGGSILLLGQMLSGVASYGLLIVALDVAGARRCLFAALGWTVGNERGG